MSGLSHSEAARTPGWERYPPLRIRADGSAFEVLDQTVLPFTVRFLTIDDAGGCANAIRGMQLRGAPLIGVAAAAGMALAARADARDGALHSAANELLASRPTAVNLRWAVAGMLRLLEALPVAERAEAALAHARALQDAEHHCCERIGEQGLELLRSAARSPRAQARGRLDVLTHCNAGWLATGAWGTALAPLYKAAAEGLDLHVWVDETRPRNQGARLTAWELGQAGIAHSIVVDNCAAHLMQRGMVDLCLVGSDRTTASGDVCNKIGTYAKALAALDNGVPFYVALPCSTIDWEIADGVAEIDIEARDAAEVLMHEGAAADGSLHRLRAAPEGSVAVNFAFDVTPSRLVSALICEHGVFSADGGGMSRLRGVASGAPEQV